MRAFGPIPIGLASDVRLTPRQRLAAEAEAGE